MSDVSFSEEEHQKPKPVRTDSFGLSTFLVKKGLVKNIQAAKRLSNLIMLVTVIVSFILILVINASDGENAIDEKYYYDPTIVD